MQKSSSGINVIALIFSFVVIVTVVVTSLVVFNHSQKNDDLSTSETQAVVSTTKEEISVQNQENIEYANSFEFNSGLIPATVSVVYNNDLYYIKSKTSFDKNIKIESLGGIYKINANSKKEEKISDACATQMFVYNDKLYYVGYQNGELYLNYLDLDDYSKVKKIINVLFLRTYSTDDEFSFDNEYSVYLKDNFMYYSGTKKLNEPGGIMKFNLYTEEVSFVFSDEKFFSKNKEYSQEFGIASSKIINGFNELGVIYNQTYQQQLYDIDGNYLGFISAFDIEGKVDEKYLSNIVFKSDEYSIIEKAILFAEEDYTREKFEYTIIEMRIGKQMVINSDRRYYNLSASGNNYYFRDINCENQFEVSCCGETIELK